MKDTSLQIRNVILCMLVLIFAILSIALSRLIRLHFSVIVSLAIAFGVLGLALVVLTARLRERRIQKTFFILAGVSAAGIPICAILHNLVHGLFIAWFGEGFWERYVGGGDEPVFFILAVFVCPALFLVAAVGSIALLMKGRIQKGK